MNTYLKYLHTKFFTILLPVVMFSSCKEQDVEIPSFDVKIDKTTYAVNEDITFKVEGGADIVTFFSGEPDKEYKYKERDTISGNPQLQFKSYYQASTQTNTLSLLASTDFTGTIDIPSIQKATWTDITSRATLSTGVDNTPSGVIDLSDFLVSHGPVYLAYKYTATKASAQPTWTVKNIEIDNVQADGSKISLATSANMVWGAISILNPAKVWSSSATQIQFTTSPAGSDDNEDWIITQPIQLNRIQRNLGTSIKSSPTTKLTDYVFPGYTQAGTYTVTFEAINANRWDKKTTVKEFTITVQ